MGDTASAQPEAARKAGFLQLGDKAAESASDGVAPPVAPELDLPAIPLWWLSLVPSSSVEFTDEGTQFIVNNAPEVEELEDWDEDKLETFGFHLIDGDPWISWRGHLIGKVSEYNRKEAIEGLGLFDHTIWRLEVQGMIGWSTQSRYVFPDDESMHEEDYPRPEILIRQPQWRIAGGRHQLTWFSHNPIPSGNAALIPDGLGLTVQLMDGARKLLRPYIQSGADIAVYATLHMAPPETPKGKAICQVRVNGETVGRLAPQTAGRMAPLVENLESRGYVPTTWAIVSGNSLMVEMSVYPERTLDIDETWLAAPKPPRTGPHG